MNKKMIFGSVFLLGILVLPVISMYANEVIDFQKQSHKRSTPLIQRAKEEIKTNTRELINLDDFANANFLGMDENDIVFQINNGGFLSSSTIDPDSLKQGYLESNPKDKLTAMTVSEAKEHYKTDLKNYYASLLKK